MTNLTISKNSFTPAVFSPPSSISRTFHNMIQKISEVFKTFIGTIRNLFTPPKKLHPSAFELIKTPPKAPTPPTRPLKQINQFTAPSAALESIAEEETFDPIELTTKVAQVEKAQQMAKASAGLLETSKAQENWKKAVEHIKPIAQSNRACIAFRRTLIGVATVASIAFLIGQKLAQPPEITNELKMQLIDRINAIHNANLYQFEDPVYTHLNDEEISNLYYPEAKAELILGRDAQQCMSDKNKCYENTSLFIPLCKETMKACLKPAWRKLSLLLHPDKNPGYKEQAQNAFVAANNAYDILRNSIK